MIAEIKTLIPHREPFLFVDEIESASPTEIIGYKTYGSDFDIFKGHFSILPIVPGTIQVESMAQLGGAGLRKAGLIGEELFGLATIENARFLNAVYFNSKVKMVIKNIRIGTKIIRQSGISYVDDEPVIEAEWVCAKI